MYANHQNDSNDGDNNEGREVEQTSRLHKDSVGGIVVKGSSGKNMRHFEMKHSDKILKVFRPAVGHGGGSDSIFEDKVPADYPGEQFAESGIGIGISRAGDGAIEANSA